MLAQRNKNAIIGLAFIQVALLAVYGALVSPGTTITGIDTVSLITVLLSCIGFLYINHYKREFLANVITNWVLVFIFASQVTFIFIRVFISMDDIKEQVVLYMNGDVFGYSLPATVMLTLVYANLKAFLKLQDLIIVAIVGALGYSANLVVCLLVQDMYDFGEGLCVYFFAAVYYLFLRFIGLPVRIFSKSNKSIPITNNMAVAGIIVAFIFFQLSAGGFIGDVNTLYCQFFAILGYIILNLNKTNTVRLQRIFQVTVSSGVLMSVGGTLFQNFAAPATIGLIFGLGHSFFGEKLKRKVDEKFRKIPDPAKLFWLFGLPAIFASIIAFAGIAQYDSKSANKMDKKFPYPQMLTDSLSLAFKQLALLPTTFGIATATGIVAGLILKYTSDNNELQVGDLIWDESQEVTAVEEEEEQDDVQRIIPPPPPRRQTPNYVPPQFPPQNAQPAFYQPAQPPQLPPQYRNDRNEYYQYNQQYPNQPNQNPDIIDQVHENNQEQV